MSGRSHALFKIVESDRMRRAAELRECSSCSLAPDLARRFPDDPAKCATAVAQLHHEQPWPAIFSGLRVPRERTLAIVDLRFLPGISLKPATDFRFSRSQLADETLYRVVRAVVAVMLDQILVDRRPRYGPWRPPPR